FRRSRNSIWFEGESTLSASAELRLKHQTVSTAAQAAYWRATTMNQVRSLAILRGSASTLAVTLVLSGAAMLPAYGASTTVGYNWAGVYGADITGTGSVGHQQIASELRNQALVNAAINANIGAIPN